MSWRVKLPGVTIGAGVFFPCFTAGRVRCLEWVRDEVFKKTKDYKQKKHDKGSTLFESSK